MKSSIFSIPTIIKIIKLFASRQIEEIAKEIGFTQRRRGVTAATFFTVFTVGAWSLHEITLETLASKCCEVQHGLQLTRQALFQRLKTGSDLLKTLMESSVAYAAKYSMATETIEVLKQFKNVFICDSTLLSLPDKLKQIFKGLGGNNSKSAIKIQLMFSLMERKFRSIELCSATGNDSNYTPNIAEKLSIMDLIIFDLGFFNAVAFKEIETRGAFFLSRIKANTKFYIDSIKRKEQYTKVDIIEILKESAGVVDQEIYIGGNSKTRMKVRLVAIRLPEVAVNERRRKANKKAKSCNKVLTDAETELLAWNIFITNIAEDMLSARTICEVYRLRWQIELVFKGWKSHFGIDKMGNVGERYFECLIYGKLIIITLMTTIFSALFSAIFRRQRRLLSMLKFFKSLREKAEILLKSIQNIFKNADKLYEAITDVINRSLHEKRNRKTTQQVLMGHDLPEVVLQMLA